LLIGESWRTGCTNEGVATGRRAFSRRSLMV